MKETKITEIRYDKKVNLGNYESEAIGVTVVVGEKESEVQALVRAKDFVSMGFNGEVKEEPSKEEKKAVKADTPSKTASTTKTRASKATTKKPAAKTKKAQELSEKEVSSDDVKKNFKGKGAKATIKYDREIQEHKHALSTILDAEYDGWKKDADLKAKASKLSKELLPGTPFKDAKGVIVEEFKNLIHSTMSEGEDDL